MYKYQILIDNIHYIYIINLQNVISMATILNRDNTKKLFFIDIPNIKIM